MNFAAQCQRNELFHARPSQVLWGYGQEIYTRRHVQPNERDLRGREKGEFERDCMVNIDGTF